MVTSTLIKSAIDSLENNFSKPKDSSEAQKNIEILSSFLSMSKIELETYLSQATLILLNDEEYTLLRVTIQNLIEKNKNREEGEENLVDCPKCLGAGDLPPLVRSGHPSTNPPRKCTFCQGACRVTSEHASQFTG